MFERSCRARHRGESRAQGRASRSAKSDSSPGTIKTPPAPPVQRLDALMCSLDLGEDLLAFVWGSAPIGFAELTCVAEINQLDDLIPQRGQRGRRGSASEPMRYLASGGGSTGHSPPALRPTATSADALESYVAGHRWRQPQRTRATRRAAAADIGIVLREHETWCARTFAACRPTPNCTSAGSPAVSGGVGQKGSIV